MRLNKVLMQSIQQDVNSGNKYLIVSFKHNDDIEILYKFDFEWDSKTRDVTTIWYNKKGSLYIKCMDSVSELEVAPINRRD